MLTFCCDFNGADEGFCVDMCAYYSAINFTFCECYSV